MRTPSALCPPARQAPPSTRFEQTLNAASERTTHFSGEEYLCIQNVDQMLPFLMCVASDSDLWLFVGSNGGFTAGRVDPDHALFPYQTADKILSQPKASGVTSLLIIDGVIWEPWAPESPPDGITRNLYKHVTGTSVILEEINHGLGLVFRWTLSASDRFGLVRTCELQNLTDSRRDLRMLDGWNHLLPHGVTQETYSRYSYLAAAYMRHETVAGSGIGIYTLNSGVTDRAEPCESLRVSCAWSLGLEHATPLLSDQQIDAFRRGLPVTQESEVRGVFGAHLLVAEIELEAAETRQWFMVADTGLDHTALWSLHEGLLEPEALQAHLVADLSGNALALKRRIAGADAIQQSADAPASIHHFANVLFNCMRGGTLHDNYHFPRSDFAAFLKCRNRELFSQHTEWLTTLPDPCSLDRLLSHATETSDPHLARIAGEYLPICFSRRHGDPSRPWNRFEIHTKDAEGGPRFAYAGNWRDIFQNWESLAYSYPRCFESMIAIFLNASTADGYNPYRITRNGIDWEVLEANDPWSQIGYWGDHQIVYLLRLLEGHEHFHPGQLSQTLNRRTHPYACVPYEIAGFDALRKDPKNSITFNHTLHEKLIARAEVIGGDGKLLTDETGQITLVSLAEKLLVPLLVKLSNLVPGGGIWLNTQRPEWNDANNALAGWGLSVVTVCHMRRYLAFLDKLIDGEVAEFSLSEPVAQLLADLTKILPELSVGRMDDLERGRLSEALGRAGEKHRTAIYAHGIRFFTPVGHQTLKDFISMGLAAVDATLRINRRDSSLFHSYNLLEQRDQSAIVHHLDLMLEGQVAALSSGTLDPAEALSLLSSLRSSTLYRADQHSYLLYPDRTIQPFLERNTLPTHWEKQIPQLAEIVEHGDRSLIRRDSRGRAHFHPDLTNTRDLQSLIDRLTAEPRWHDALSTDRSGLLGLWEQVFRHQSFTGRSGSMFAFEGLGSIYWHMIAKLLLAIQEIYQKSSSFDPTSVESRQLAAAYRDIRNGLGFTKDAPTYGAFPTDPYSHSPRHRGAQQPGMTGQVKEEILTRLGELGVQIEGGCLRFNPTLLTIHEFFTTSHVFQYIDVNGEIQAWKLDAMTLAFTAFQTPICYQLAEQSSITVNRVDGKILEIDGNQLPSAECKALFARNHVIQSITVKLPKDLVTNF